MKKHQNNSVTFDVQEFEQLLRIFRRIDKMLDEIPAMAAPSIKSQDIEKIVFWRQQLEKTKKEKVDAKKSDTE